jgi:hypothetical protein
MRDIQITPILAFPHQGGRDSRTTKDWVIFRSKTISRDPIDHMRRRQT